ncbi:L,D-transpeptidase [Clostridium sp. 'deep sea']|uniref:L,D-transpeptidase family protein n=1 Tax=Clostridium sp. 'deep sea' TaxID=2779445 RepID=UPI001896485C|nr:L,D-transpeptidase family protein [Clostridium sp. 'deep sea']QOR36823.1 L,D-transpeptidase [Clostridium sp. 'deep sea']
MNRKLILGLLIIAVIVTSGYFYFRKINSVPKQQQVEIDEDINGYSLVDDMRLTQIVLQNEAHRAYCVGQNKKIELFANLFNSSSVTVLKDYKSRLPNNINNDIKYFQYNLAFDYFLITADEASLKEKPKVNSPVLATIATLEKITLLQKVQAEQQEGSNIWYRVVLENNNEIKEGYIHSSQGTPRKFQFNKMQAEVADLQKLLREGELHFIRNYKNYNGASPRINNENVDEYGFRHTHSAPAYLQADINSSFRYIPDGILVRVLEEINDFYYVNVPTFEGNYYVPKQYINLNESLKQLKKVIVVDRSQQNEATFEVDNEQLNLISYTIATTGVKADYSFVTTLGMYKTLEKKDRFQYLKKGTSEIAGYAPYAIRFTGGAYTHGVPVNYIVENGEQKDPGHIEYLQTIGTFPRSSMCVRNFTSHAQFMYDWIDIENGAVIVIE